MGTRNYALELIIAKFQEQISINTKPTNVTSEQVILVVEPDTTKANGCLAAKSASDQKDLMDSDYVEKESTVDSDGVSRPTLPIIVRTKKDAKMAPLQASGLYTCLMIGCNALLPVCRMLNHARYFHKDFLQTERSPTEWNYGKEPVVMRWTIPGRTSSRKIIQIQYSGLFFLIYNVRKLEGETTINSWVQCVRPSALAREFNFKLILEYGDAQVSYTDFVSALAAYYLVDGN